MANTAATATTKPRTYHRRAATSESKPTRLLVLAIEDTSSSKRVMVDVLRAYLNRGDLQHDLQETVRQLAQALSADDTPARSIKTINRERGTRRLSNRLTDEQVRELVAAFEAGATRMELAERYGIGRTSVANVATSVAGESEPRKCGVERSATQHVL